MSLAGANTAQASSLDGSAANAAAPAMRNMFSVRWFDIDVDAGISFPGSFGSSDFQNRGSRGSASSVDRTRQFLNLYGGASMQFGNFGVATSIDSFRYDVELPETQAVRPGVSVTFTRYTALAAYGFFDNQLVLGGGIRALTTGIQQFGGAEPSREVLTFLGVAPEAGAIWKPKTLPFSFGATFRGGISAAPVFNPNRSTDTIQRAGAFVLPSTVTAPWELELGVALQLGPRPLNPIWINPRDDERQVRDRIARAREERKRRPLPEDEEKAIRKVEDLELDAIAETLRQTRYMRDYNWPREKLLIMASLLMTGPSTDAVSVIGFVDQERDLVGQRVSFSPRVGFETEPLVDRMKVRLGTYLEPSRFQDGFPRQHFTFGAEVKLFTFRGWYWIPEMDICAITAADMAPRYLSLGGSICIWH